MLHLLRPLAAAAGLAVLTSCTAGADQPSTPPAPNTDALEKTGMDVSVLRTGHTDRFVDDAVGPAQRAAQHEVKAVLTGRIEAFADGRTLWDDDTGDAAFTVVMKVKATKVFKGRDQLTGDTGYVELLHGLFDGDHPPPRGAGARLFTQALPPGTRVHLYLTIGDKVSIAARQRVEGDDRGYPPHARRFGVDVFDLVLEPGPGASASGRRNPARQDRRSTITPRMQGGMEDLSAFPQAWQEFTSIGQIEQHLDRNGFAAH